VNLISVYIGSLQPQINVKISSNIIDFLSNSPSDRPFGLTLDTDLMMEYDARQYMGA
jgi:hypothetical protein